MRVPMKLSATVILEGKPCGKVLISDLSSTGLALLAAEDNNLPSAFYLRFRLGFLSRPVTVSVEVKNRATTEGGVRIGCIFPPANEKVRNLVNNYIYRLLNFTFADNVIYITAFLCFIDVWWKLAARLVNGYYIETEFGRASGAYIPNQFSESAFICYAVASFTAVFIVTYRTIIKGKPRFILSIILLTIASVYLLWKNIFCAQYKLWNAEYLIAKAGFWWEIFLNLCAAGSVVICFAFLRKISFTFNAMRMHTKLSDKELTTPLTF